jgi:E3 ubiquitin-protein ligase DOA10
LHAHARTHARTLQRKLGPRTNKYVRAARRIQDAFLFLAGRGLKFAFFIAVELGVFPIFCGLLMGYLTLPLFGPGATVAARREAYQDYPVLFLSLCWLVGSSFMFRFAAYISLLRQVVRPGVFWFIRDPNDPNFKPMQEIMEKPMLRQLRKVSMGVLLYTGIILCFVGGVTLTGLGLDWWMGMPEGSPLKLLPLRLVVA